MSNPDVIRSLFTTDCSLIVEKDGRVSWCDAGAADLFGMSEGFRPGWAFPEIGGLYFPDSMTRLRFEEFPLGSLLVGEVIADTEICVRSERTAGEEVWLSVRAEPVFSQNLAEVEAALIVCHDVTGRKKALRGLEDAHAALQALVQASPLSILALEPDGRVSFWNRAAELMFGWTEDEVLGRHMPFIPDESREESRRMRDQDLAGQIVLGQDIRRRRRDGSAIDIAVSRAPIRDRKGIITGTICVYVDMTERHEMEERLRQAAKRESLGILAGGIAHDFNNLLTTIMGHASLALQDAQPRSEQAKALKCVMESVDRAVRLTNQMLAYAGQSNFRPEPLELSGLIVKMLPLIHHTAGGRIAVELDLEPELPHVAADVEHLRYMVSSLVLNAREAIPGEGTIAIRTALDSKTVLLEIRDDGCGMDPDTQMRMFDPFFSTKFTGRGLGLAAVLGIVRRHGGNVVVKSELRKGTSVCISFPAADA